MSVPTTTLSAIRADMVRIIRELVPNQIETITFVEEREEIDFESWANDNPQVCFRRFVIGDTFTEEVPDVIHTEVWENMLMGLLVGYPKQQLAIYGKGRKAMREVIREDRDLLKDNLADAGYRNYTEPATVTLEGTTVVEDTNILLLDVELRVRFWRTLNA